MVSSSTVQSTLAGDDRDRADAQAVGPGVVDQGGARVEAHRLVVEQADVELDRAMHLQPGGGVGNERES